MIWIPTSPLQELHEIIHRKLKSYANKRLSDPCKVKTSGTPKLHKQYALWRGKHSFEFDMNYNPCRTPIFKTDTPIFAHMDGSNIEQKRHNKNMIMLCFPPPITLNYIFHASTSAPKCLLSKFLLVKVLDPLLFSCVMDNVYHGHDKLFPHKWFCHGLLLAVMWDSACRLKQP